MRIKLHHVNVCSKDVPGLEAFYRDVLDLQPEPSLEKGRILDKDGYPGKVAFLSDGETQFHLARRTSASASAQGRRSIPSSAAILPSARTTSRPSSSASPRRASRFPISAPGP